MNLNNQMSIFDFLKTQPKKHFNPIAAYAMHGSGFVKGKERITKFFSENPKKSDRVTFLKKEYGVGGFGFWSNDPCVVHQGMSDASGHRIEYNDENGKMCEIKVTYDELEGEIDRLIASGRYMEARNSMTENKEVKKLKTLRGGENE